MDDDDDGWFPTSSTVGWCTVVLVRPVVGRRGVGAGSSTMITEDVEVDEVELVKDH